MRRCSLSQLVACILDQGLLVAADRRVAVGDGPEPDVHTFQKLFPLGSAAVLATSGAAVGVAISRALAATYAQSPRLPFAELESHVLAVFQQEYDDFVRQGGLWFTAHPHAHRLSYFLLGGQETDRVFTFRFYASEAHGQPYCVLPTANILTAPRRLGLESRLTRALSVGAPASELRVIAIEGLRQIARKEEAVSGPFDIALLDESGLHIDAVE